MSKKEIGAYIFMAADVALMFLGVHIFGVRYPESGWWVVYLGVLCGLGMFAADVAWSEYKKRKKK